MVVTRDGVGAGGGRRRVKEVKCWVMEGDETSGGEHPTECNDLVLSRTYTPELYMMLLANVNPANLILEKRKL